MWIIFEGIIIDRKQFIKFIKKYNFKTTKRFNGSHEIFKSKDYEFNFPIPVGKEVKKGMYWNFKSKLNDYQK